MVFKDVHEPIIDRAIWEQIQEKRGKMRKRKPKDTERNIFSGLLVCADCGHNLNYHFNQGSHDIKYFNCTNYRGNRGTCTSTHYVRVDFLEQVVLGEIKRLTKYAVRYEDEFLKAVMGNTQKTAESECKRKQKNFPPQEPETMNWTAFLSGSMRIIFPANCLMDAFPECPSATRRNNWNSRSA